MAKIGINFISHQALRLNAPNDDTLAVSFERLLCLYESAYGHRPRSELKLGGPHRAMRSYVRRWLSDWDLDRLYGQRKHDVIEEQPRPLDYTEDSDFESDNGAGETE